MKILKTSSIYSTQQNQKTNFKQISPQIKKQVIATANNPTTRDMFIKMAGVLGLTSIISWVNTLKNNKDANVIENLNNINNYWIEQENEQYINPETNQAYLDIVSNADSTEIDMWTQAVINPIESNDKNINTNSLTEGIKKAFLDLKTNETTMSISANKKFMTMLSQIRAFSQVQDERKNSFMANLEQKLNSLIKQAQELQTSEETFEVYEKISNIIRIFSRINLLEVKVDNNATLQEEKVNDITTPTIEEPTASLSTLEASTIEGVKVVGKIDIQNDGISRFKPEQTKQDNAKIETPVLKEFNVTEKNKDFIQLFKKYFKKDTYIQPEIYADKIDFIQKLYDGYEKESVKKAFLKRFSEENFLQTLEKYYEFTNGNGAELDFIVFSHMEKLKHKYCGELSQEDFNKLLKYKNKEVKYFSVQDLQDNIIISFSPSTTAEERLKISSDFHNTLFNAQENILFANKAEVSYDKKDVKQELLDKLSKNADEYPNISQYLNLDTSDIAEELQNNNSEGAFDTAEYLLNSKEMSEKLSALAKIIQNKAFDNLFEGVHSRLRFIERFVFDTPRNTCKTDYEIKQITSRKITRFIKTLESAKEINVGNYTASDIKRKGYKCAPKLIIKDYEFSLDKNSRVRTIFHSDEYASNPINTY